MKYICLIYFDEQGAPDQAEREHCYDESARFAQELHASGKFVAAAPLHPTSTATSLRVRDGRTLVTDGPFAETREQLGGFFMINAKDLDEAISIASKIRLAAGELWKSGRWWRLRACPRISFLEVSIPAFAARYTGGVRSRGWKWNWKPSRTRKVQGDRKMRFLVIVKANKDSEAGRCRAGNFLKRWASSTRSW